MKISRVKSKHPLINKLRDSFLGNLFYLICLHWMVLSWIAGIAIAGFIILLVAEKIFPETVHALGYAMDRTMFDEMKENNHYHAAAFIMEQNPNFLKNSSYGGIYLYELADVYVHIGEYNKAEPLFLNIFNTDATAWQAFEDLESADVLDGIDVQIIKSMTKFSSGNSLADLYEKMGDFPNQKKYYLEAASALSPQLKSFTRHLIDSLSQSGLNALVYGWSKRKIQLDDNIFLRGIKVCYHEDKSAAISQLQAVVDSIQEDFSFSTEFKLKHITQLVEWKLADGHKLSSYRYLYMGVGFCEIIKDINNNALQYAGKLSEQCFAVGDKENGCKLLQRYLCYLSYKYDESDVERLTGRLHLCRYYEMMGQWQELTEELSYICNGLKNKISENFVGLSSQQREFLAASLRKPFDLAIEVAFKHPSPEIANLCFDNLIFERGLLLRADIAQKLSAGNSEELKEIYDEWAKAKRELSCRQYVNGPGNAIAKWELNRKIADLDKQLSNNPELTETTADFPSRGKIQRKLKRNGYFIEFGESNGQLYALVLPQKGDAELVPLCKEKDIITKLGLSIDEIYTDTTLTNALLKPLFSKIPEHSYIAYSVSGLFSQISVPTLCIKYDFANSLYLSDIYDFSLYSSPISFVEIEDGSKLFADNDIVSLWGGIDYGSEDTLAAITPFVRGLRRGQPLKNLPGSQREISYLSSLFSKNGYKVNVHTGLNATKEKFIDDSPNILHISTHGSFDGGNESSPLATSYLFFANANSSWMNPSTSSEKQEGIVSGGEVETMRLSNCKLVVLSACETGLGYSNAREGVYGLQRAFKLAGAQSILMSMWDVNDGVTARYMDAFYKALLSGVSAKDAVRHASNEIRKDNPFPSDWGSFVLMD